MFDDVNSDDINFLPSIIHLIKHSKKNKAVKFSIKQNKSASCDTSTMEAVDLIMMTNRGLYISEIHYLSKNILDDLVLNISKNKKCNCNPIIVKVNHNSLSYLVLYQIDSGPCIDFYMSCSNEECFGNCG